MSQSLPHLCSLFPVSVVSYTTPYPAGCWVLERVGRAGSAGGGRNSRNSGGGDWEGRVEIGPLSLFMSTLPNLFHISSHFPHLPGFGGLVSDTTPNPVGSWVLGRVERSGRAGEAGRVGSGNWPGAPCIGYHPPRPPTSIRAVLPVGFCSFVRFAPFRCALVSFLFFLLFLLLLYFLSVAILDFQSSRANFEIFEKCYAVADSGFRMSTHRRRQRNP